MNYSTCQAETTASIRLPEVARGFFTKDGATKKTFTIWRIWLGREALFACYYRFRSVMCESLAAKFPTGQ